MPITPRFHLSQTIQHLIIIIHIPHIRVSASTLEIIVDESEFHFYSQPYLLHLNFSSSLPNHGDNGNGSDNGNNKRLVDDETIGKEAKATYDPSKDNGTLVVKIWKQTECIWEDLDLLGRLMMSNNNNRNHQNGHMSSYGKEKIQVLDSTQSEEHTTNHDEHGENSTGVDTDVDVTGIDIDVENQRLDELQSCLKPHYGFLKMHHSVFTAYAREGLCHEMLEIPDPDDIRNDSNLNTTCTSNRAVATADGDDDNVNQNQNMREMRLEIENDKFCPNRYLGDLYLSDDYNDEDADMTFIEAKHMIPHWRTNHKDVNAKTVTSEENVSSISTITSKLESINMNGGDKATTRSIATSASAAIAKNNNDMNEDSQTENNEILSGPSFFTEKESLLLTSIKAQVPPLPQISKEQTLSTLLSLLDILYAYVYDHRFTYGDPTCESSWTIVMLSPTFSWLESYNPPYDTIDQVIRWSIRRALIYPYLRNFDMLSTLLVDDIISILCGGRRVVLRCLLQIHQILDKSEVHYLFNKLYINHYVCWLQLIDDSVLESFAAHAKECLSLDGRGSLLLTKDKLDLDLELFERQAFSDQIQSSSSSDSSCSTSDDSSDGYDDSSRSSDGNDEDNKHTCHNEFNTTSTETKNEVRKQPTKNSSSLLDDQIGNSVSSNGYEDRNLFSSTMLDKSETIPSESKSKKMPLIAEI